MRWVLWLAACGGGESTPAPTPVAPAPEAAHFVGSGACEGCHDAEQRAWGASHHARAWTPPATGPTDPQRDRPVVGWVGWDPLRQPLIDVGEGRVQVSDRAWDPKKKEWFAVFDDGRQPGDRGHWTGPSMTWNSQCAPCHTTNLTIGYRADAHAYDTVATEHGVGCEACHGPGSGHAADQRELGSPGLDGCGGCHARRADLAPAGAPASAFLDRYAPQLVDLSAAFYADGQVREEDFEYNAFLTSRMYREGVQCTDCHDPHSGELKRQGDALCLDCHEERPGWEAHDHHDGKVACVDCHMPQTTYMQRHPRRDHGFRIPDPALAAEVGAPDTCTRSCHSDHDATWSAKALGDWGVDPSKRPHRGRARAVAMARAGLSPQGALTLLTSDPHPTWRAVGAGLLVAWGGVPEVHAALSRATSDPADLVRFAAVGSLPDGSPAARRALRDDKLAVRVQASRRMMAQLGPDRLPELHHYLQTIRDQPDGVHELGSWLAVHGDPAGVAELKRGWRLWKGEPAIAHGLAVMTARQGDDAGAVAILEEAVKHRPDDPGLWDALGLARAAVQDNAGAIEALQKALALDPNLARSRRNLELLLQGPPTP